MLFDLLQDLKLIMVSSNNSSIFGQIFKIATNEEFSEKDFSAIEFNHSGVKFFQKPILNSCSFWAVSENLWLLEFFKGTNFQQSIVLSFCNFWLPQNIDDFDLKSLKTETFYKASITFKGIKLETLGAFSLIATEPDTELKSDPLIKIASETIRETWTLSLADFIFSHGRGFFADGKGLCIIGDTKIWKDQFFRQLIMFSLAKAYLAQIEHFVSQLADCASSLEELAGLNANYLEFSAKYYFSQPIKSDRTDLLIAWNVLKEKLFLTEINNELKQQVQSVHDLLDRKNQIDSLLAMQETNQQLVFQNKANQEITQQLAEQAIANQKTNDLLAAQVVKSQKTNSRLGWVSGLVGILSLLTLTEVTPSKLTSFIDNWRAVITSSEVPEKNFQQPLNKQ